MTSLLALGTLTIYLGLAAAQDCSALLGSSGRKRFILDDVANTFNKLPKQVRDILPGHPEVNRRCRFGNKGNYIVSDEFENRPVPSMECGVTYLTRLSNSQTQTLKKLFNEGYSICVGCSQVNSDHGRCHSIEVCRKGTSCIQGYNQNRIPTYYWHGCCDDSDPKCKSGLSNLDVPYNDRKYTLPYRKTVCKGPVCNENGYTSQKNDLINKLVGTTAAPAATTQAPSQTTPTQAGPVNGGYTTWSSWGSCDKSCNIGVRIRTRACTNPVPARGGADCAGASKDTELCNVNPCA